MVPPAFFQTHQPEIEKMYFGVKVNALQFLSPLWVSSLISGTQFKRKLIFSTINVFSGFAFDMVTRTSPLCWNLQFHHQTWSQSLFLRALWGNFTARPPFFVFLFWGNVFFGETFSLGNPPWPPWRHLWQVAKDSSTKAAQCFGYAPATILSLKFVANKQLYWIKIILVEIPSMENCSVGFHRICGYFHPSKVERTALGYYMATNRIANGGGPGQTEGMVKPLWSVRLATGLRGKHQSYGHESLLFITSNMNI